VSLLDIFNPIDWFRVMHGEELPGDIPPETPPVQLSKAELQAFNQQLIEVIREHLEKRGPLTKDQLTAFLVAAHVQLEKGQLQHLPPNMSIHDVTADLLNTFATDSSEHIRQAVLQTCYQEEHCEDTDGLFKKFLEECVPDDSQRMAFSTILDGYQLRRQMNRPVDVDDMNQLPRVSSQRIPTNELDSPARSSTLGGWFRRTFSLSH